MKLKVLLTTSILIVAIISTTIAQNVSKYCYIQGDECIVKECVTMPCNCEGKHPIYNLPANQTPKKIPQLGTNVQFGTLKGLGTSDEVYSYLKRRYSQNQRGDAAELDALFTSMGYTGFGDPTFTNAEVTKVLLPCGTVGNLGAGGHKYVYADVTDGKNCPMTAYKITPKNACGIYIMETCGNAFFAGCQESSECKTTVCKSPIPTVSEGVTKYGFMRNDSCFVRVCDQTGPKLQELHEVYKMPAGIEEPKDLPRLGTNPQFGTLRNYNTVQEVYDHLQNRYRQNSSDAAELDALWKAMGYSGFKDPSFTVDKMTMIYYNAGVVGMLGAGGHTYKYTRISPRADFMLKAYKIKAPANCDLAIMETCGNAFFSGCTTLENCRELPCGCN